MAKSSCACEWGGWGRLSDDGPGHYNPDRSEDPLDDGAERRRFFEIQGRLQNEDGKLGIALPTVRVPAQRFSGMTWVAEEWGVRPIIAAGATKKDYVREAIQTYSLDAKRRQLFCHTGWRHIDDKWAYLTSTGAIGADGIEVELETPLNRYALPLTPTDPRKAMHESLQLLRVGPLSVTLPLFGVTYLAPLAQFHPSDLTLWPEGQSGSIKSTLAALFLCHFGTFDRLTLPGEWIDTANHLEKTAFLLKDVPFVIDDYAPSGNDAREFELKASRLLRSQGNLQARGRLRSDLSIRPRYTPRGIIISTGEQHPPGLSVLARTLVLEVEREKIDIQALTRAQNSSHLLPHAMSAYISWLAPQIPSLPETLRATFEAARAKATGSGV